MKKRMLAVFFLILVAPVYGYIDPGTGSILFSALTGLIVTIFFFFKNLLVKIKSIPALLSRKPGDKASAYSRRPFTIYSEGKQYWNVLGPVLQELADRGYECYYLTSGTDDPGLEFTSPSTVSRYIGKGHMAFGYLNSLDTDVCLMTTPGLDVYHLKRSKKVGTYVHILHAVNDATLYRLFGLDYYDVILLTGEFQKAPLQELEQIRGTIPKQYFVTGCTYMDVLAKKVTDIQSLITVPENHLPTVLISPSWGENALLYRFGMKLLEPLAKTGFNLIIRPHPQSFTSEKDLVNSLKEKLKNYSNVEWDNSRENLIAMARADVMISDFSGIVFDFAFLFSKPVLYPAFVFDPRPYDAGDLNQELWTSKVLKEWATQLQESDFDRIPEILSEVLTDNRHLDAVEKTKNQAWQYPGEGAQRTVDVLIKLKDQLVQTE